MASKKIILQARPFLAKSVFNRSAVTPLLAKSNFYRHYSSESEQPKKGNTFVTLGLLAAGAAGAYYFLSSPSDVKNKDTSASTTEYKSREYYQKIYDYIAERLDENPDYDDGSYGPVIVRLAWHAAGTYHKELNNGGITGATMRFAEGKHAANGGLNVARDFMDRVKKVFPDITYSDLWTLGGICAIQEMGGPIIPWRPGRSDEKAEKEYPPEGRLPDASQGHQHVRDVFYRMGFNDQEIVALIGAHALGRCHTDRSGFKGPWTFSPTQLTNDFYVKLLEEKWQVKKWNGPKQYEDAATQSLMMLPTDMSFLWDKEFLKHVKAYAADEQLFFKDFSDVFSRLLELGFVVPKNAPTYTFKPTI